jgi:hypothetical protein
MRLVKPTNTYQTPLPSINTHSLPQSKPASGNITLQPAPSYSSPSRKPKPVSQWSWNRFMIYLVTGVLMGIIMFIIVYVVTSPNPVP